MKYLFIVRIKIDERSRKIAILIHVNIILFAILFQYPKKCVCKMAQNTKYFFMQYHWFFPLKYFVLPI